MGDIKYPHQIKLNMNDELFQILKQHLEFQYKLGTLASPADLIMLHYCAAVDSNHSMLFLGPEDIETKENNHGLV